MIEFIREFWQFIRERKKLWLIPILLILLQVTCLQIQLVDPRGQLAVLYA